MAHEPKELFPRTVMPRGEEWAHAYFSVCDKVDTLGGVEAERFKCASHIIATTIAFELAGYRLHLASKAERESEGVHVKDGQIMLPRNEDEARAMVAVGEAYLRGAARA